MPPQESIRVDLYTGDWTARQAMRQAIVGIQMLDLHIRALEAGTEALRRQIDALREELEHQ